MPNLFEPDWDAARDEPPFRWRRARIGRQAGARELGVVAAIAFVLLLMTVRV